MTIEENALEYIVKAQGVEFKDLQKEIDKEISKPKHEQSEVYLRLLYGKKRGKKIPYERWIEAEHRKTIQKTLVKEVPKRQKLECELEDSSSLSGYGSTKKYITIKKLVALYNHSFSSAAIYKAISTDMNNFHECLFKFGQKYLIDLEKFEEWLKRTVKPAREKGFD